MKDKCMFCSKGKDGRKLYYNDNIGHFHRDCMERTIKLGIEEASTTKDNRHACVILSFVGMYEEIISFIRVQEEPIWDLYDKE